MTFIDEKQEALTTRRQLGWNSNKAITTTKDNKQSIETKIKNGVRILENIVLRRILIHNFVVPGHYWIEIIHSDEDETDEFMEKARKEQLTEKELPKLNGICKKANGFRESYGWYPDEALYFTKSWKTLKGNGFFNGDCELRRNNDKDKILSKIEEREAGRREENNDLSIRPFDAHQNGRFHLDKIDFTTNPYLLPGDSRTDEQIITEIRDFAKSFKDEWSFNYQNYDETNCHTFLYLLLAKCNLADIDCIGKNLDPYFKQYKISLNEKGHRNSKYEERRKLINKLSNISNYRNIIAYKVR
ncbi:hypothetical protein [uncultured Gilliamella sp.]|uniref:hypothetical protein n=1 Tax=uncultured Gilliamella sp. TaxID=1193505 RepID=UPI0025DFCDE3|nr:hypothetical protein [uncultured Gilliamella sp.]